MTRDGAFEHDIELGKEVLALHNKHKQGFSEPLHRELIQRMSFYSLPLPIINSLPPLDQLGRPDELQGWEHVRHNSKLSKEDQEKIQEMQRESDLEETVF